MRGWLRQFENRWNRQSRRRCRYGRTRQCDNGADGAEIIRMSIRIGILRRKLLLGGLYRWRGLRRDRVDVTEGQRKLHGDRKQREPCAKSDVRPHPLHDDNVPRAGSRNNPVCFRRYNITSQVMRLYVNRLRRKQFVSSTTRHCAGDRAQARSAAFTHPGG